MKKLYLFIISFLLISQSFASQQLSIDSSRDSILLGESFLFTISIDESDMQNGEGEIEIPGIENFQISSQTQELNYQNINGIVTNRMNYSLDLQSVAIGEYTLGPVRILTNSGEIIGDESILITVSDIIQTDITHDVSNLEEGNGFKGDRKNIFPIVSGISIIFLISIILYLFFSKNNNSLVQNIQRDTHEKRKDYNASIRQYFQDLSGEQDGLDSRVYFKKYNFGLRELLRYYGIQDAQKLTLSEMEIIENISENEVFKILKKSYKYEYADISVSGKTRKKYMGDILKLLQR